MSPARQRVMFVDDEPEMLLGLKDLLIPQARTWDMTFAQGGREALGLIEAQPFDVVVTDMRMPGVDGAEVLRGLRERQPQAVRVILSGYAEMESALRAVPLAHQFIAKPCESRVLREVIARACSLRAMLEDPELRAFVGGLPALPAAPSVWLRLTQALTDPAISMAAIGGIIEVDPGISARVLQLVNSAFFSLPRRITSVADAVRVLGIRVVKDLALTAEALQAFRAELPASFDLEAETRRSGATARIARRLAQGSSEATDAFTAGLLHDLGVLVLLARDPDGFGACVQQARETGWPLAVVEQELGRISHTQVGAYLLSLWGLPYSLIEAVAWHHDGPAATGAPKASDYVRLAVSAVEAAERRGGAGEGSEPLEVPAWAAPLTAEQLLAMVDEEMKVSHD